MLVVVALGGNALVRRGEPVHADNQRFKVQAAARVLAPVACAHQLVIGYGDGPQADLLALQGAAYARVETYPIDVLGAHTEGTIAYLIEQELGNLLPCDRAFATILTTVEVDPCDPAFKRPATFIGPVYLREEAEQLTEQKGWVFRPDGDKWRRVVAAPAPKRMLDLRPIKWLLERNTIVIAAGGGGIPATPQKAARRKLVGVECVIDKDLAFELLARELGADLFVMLTDADAVYVNWGTAAQNAIRRATPAALASLTLPTQSIGAKVNAACRFAEATGKRAAIGALADLEQIMTGEAGTTISIMEPGIVYAAATPVARFFNTALSPAPGRA